METAILYGIIICGILVALPTMEWIYDTVCEFIYKRGNK